MTFTSAPAETDADSAYRDWLAEGGFILEDARSPYWRALAADMADPEPEDRI